MIRHITLYVASYWYVHAYILQCTTGNYLQQKLNSTIFLHIQLAIHTKAWMTVQI